MEVLADENPRRHPPAADYGEDHRAARARGNVYAFEVAPGQQDRDPRAVEAQFKVKVAEVRSRACTARAPPGRYVGRRPDWKKAYVRLPPRVRSRSSSSRF